MKPDHRQSQAPDIASPFDGLPVKAAAFLLPSEGVDMRLFPAPACDQYTAQRDKWEEADNLVGGAPSALRLIIPEAYLDESAARIPLVNHAMTEYLQSGVLTERARGMTLVKRQTQSGARWGLVAAIDLNSYSFEAGAKSDIRPTEGTILSRIPPRLAVRADAPLELTHVMLLIDDKKRRLIEPLRDQIHTLERLYDTDLMLNGGHITGWAVTEDGALRCVADALNALRSETRAGDIFLAVGDGNHSLATAKAHWRKVSKSFSDGENAEHPARYASVEIVNLYDDALRFEPIHRVLFGISGDAALALLSEAGITPCDGVGDMTLVTDNGDIALRVTRPTHTLPVGSLQNALDKRPLDIDYVHGEDAVRALAQKGAVSVLLKGITKESLFPSVARDGALPRKTFSMGEANEKRYYLEARKIV